MELVVGPELVVRRTPRVEGGDVGVDELADLLAGERRHGNAAAQRVAGSGGGAPSDACRAGGSGGAARKSTTSLCQAAAVSAKAAKAIPTPP